VKNGAVRLKITSKRLQNEIVYICSGKNINEYGTGIYDGENGLTTETEF
jgi:hypothetical protein